MPNEVLCWLPGFRPYSVANGAYHVRAGAWRGPVYRVGGDDELLHHMCAAIDNRRDRTGVLAMLPARLQPAGARALDGLQQAGLLLTRAVSADWDPPAAVRNYVVPLEADARMSSALAGARLLLIGGGVLGSRVAVGAAQLGIAAVTIADETLITADDQRLNLALVGARPRTTRATHLARLLRRIAPTVASARIRLPLGPGRDARLAAAVARFTHVIVATDRPDLGLWEQINRVALVAGVPWSILSTDGLQALIGPTFLPGQTACYRCWERVQRTAMQPDALRHLAEYTAAARPGAGTDFIGLPGMADLAAGFLLTDLPRLLSQTGGLTAGRSFTIDLVTLGCDLSDLPKQPRCPACAHKAHAVES